MQGLRRRTTGRGGRLARGRAATVVSSLDGCVLFPHAMHALPFPLLRTH